ncbi:MAG: phosphopyruvate hydratase [Propionicimonas sp.]|uniref:phosphopyruvate hydratase n=1 Tax=Propionicimonas sp. TaxID=1955623 RepID=UPI002B20E7C4|nr:phosphopyruvate hydratase [Propionicimonas sp.]MEA4944410.1 phosphopyruvate hydratase [Propionicimonas sp.]
MSITIERVSALEILDSRGRPTLQVSVEYNGRQRESAGVPSGASTGSGEAVELRDGDPARFGGAGTLTAAANVTIAINNALAGRTFVSVKEVDEVLIALDGTPNKASLGANAIVGTSMAVARAFAAAAGLPLWRYLEPDWVSARLPIPHFNVINGGAHAANNLDFQEFMLAPLGAPSFTDAVRAGAEVYASLKKRLSAAGHSTGLGDEGGFAPQLDRPDQVLEVLVGAIEDAGYTPGTGGVAIALDPAANGFYADGGYTVAGQRYSSEELIAYYADLVDRFGVWSIEDGLAEDDWDGWVSLTAQLGDRLQLVGDDIFVTNPAVITKGIELKAANAALIKLNQIGTVTETLEAMRLCREAGYAAMVSHRSGETPDSFIADLVVGSGCGEIKAGAPARGERVAKYNRLLEIAATHRGLPFGLQ